MNCRIPAGFRPLVVVFGLGLLPAGPALADPCRAIPQKGPMPASLARGERFSGPVVHVGDGDSLCVAVGPRRGPDWVEVRLADFYAPELNEPGGRAARSALERIASGRRVDCVSRGRTWDRVAAICRMGGRSLGDHMRAAGVAEGGRGRNGGPRPR
ncbi:MAG: thermonuclease family protein [Phenylobacterium sp.]